jgi:hypothetical protein
LTERTHEREQGEAEMKVMLLLKGDPRGRDLPQEELIGAMLRYNEELVKAGVLLAAEGLYDSSTGARVVYKAGRRTVVDGPFTEAKELIAGFMLIQVKSMDEAIEWAKRCPVEYAVLSDEEEAVVEVRPVAEAEELPTMNDELLAADRRIREQLPGI